MTTGRLRGHGHCVCVCYLRTTWHGYGRVVLRGHWRAARRGYGCIAGRGNWRATGYVYCLALRHTKPWERHWGVRRAVFVGFRNESRKRGGTSQ